MIAETSTVKEILEPWPSSDLEPVHACPVCGSPERTQLHDGLRDRVFYCAPGEWTLQQCSACRSAYLDPRPTAASIGRAYSSYYTHGGVWRPAAEELTPTRRALRALSNAYFNQRFGTAFRPAAPLAGGLAWLAPWKTAELNSVGRHLPKAREDQTLLDVGCGNGVFLRFATNAGWRAVGVDADEAAVAWCRQQGLEVKPGGIEVFNDERDRFDWITLSHIIEHIHEPSAMLRACLRLLKPGGGLWVSTPNIAALGHIHYGRHWRGLEPPRHLVLFNRASLHGALARVGFEAIRDVEYQPLYRGLARKSQAIAEGIDPYSVGIPKHPSPRVFISELRAWIDPAVREFVTVTARRPR